MKHTAYLFFVIDSRNKWFYSVVLLDSTLSVSNVIGEEMDFPICGVLEASRDPSLRLLIPPRTQSFFSFLSLTPTPSPSFPTLITSLTSPLILPFLHPSTAPSSPPLDLYHQLGFEPQVIKELAQQLLFLNILTMKTGLIATKHNDVNLIFSLDFSLLK